MASIGEQIVAARKAKGMTQEALAQEVGLTRSGIANYESGRRLPDAETLLKLSRTLDYSFETGTARAEVAPESGESATPETATPPEQAAIPSPADAPVEKRPRARLIALCALVAALAIGVGLYFLAPALRNRGDAPEDSGAITKQMFQQENTRVEGKPYLRIESEVKTQKNDGGGMWLYTVRFIETNGQSFDIDRIEANTFANGEAHTVMVDAEAIAFSGMETTIPANGEWSMDGGLPMQEAVEGIGFMMVGRDQAGEELSFVFYLPLSVS